MSDQEQDLAAYEVTPESEEAPETPIEGQEEDKATTEKDQREALYQTKYQQMKAERDELLAKVNSSGQAASPPPNQPDPTDPLPEFDPYDPAWQAAHDKQLTKNIVKELVGSQQSAAIQREWQEISNGFDQWTAKNEVPQSEVNEAIKAFIDRFPNGGSPKGTLEWVTNYIIDKSGKVRKSKTTDDLAKDAADKAGKLKTVIQPDPGSPPAPAPAKKKTQEDEILSKFEQSGKKPSDELWE